MGFGFQTTLRYRASMQGRVFRVKGSRIDVPFGKVTHVPGGNWHEGREGRWYDLGTLTDQAVLVSAWKWLFVKIRMELQEIAKFLQGKIK